PGAEGSDSFSYTLTDADGDTATATVSLSIAKDSTPSLIPGEGQVSEAGLPDGSSPETDYETTGGGFAIETGSDSVGSIVITSVVVQGVDVTGGGTVQGDYGSLEVTVNDDGVYSWTYTLDDNTLDHESQGPASDGVRDAFTVVLTDSDGDSTTEVLNIGIIDDVPVATIDTGSVQSGGSLTVTAAAGLLANDTLGADGAEVTAVDTTGIQGSLVWNPDGSYTYTAIPDATYSDVFTYTITDGDGDTSTATLTLGVTDGSPTAPMADVTVNEAALDLAQDGDDLAAGTVEGSDPSNTAETISGTLAATDPNGDALTYTAGTFTGSYGTLTIDTAGNYTYTLTAPVDGPTADNSTDTIDNAESFSYTVTDANGNSSSGTLTVDIIDDAPFMIEPEKGYLVNLAGQSVSAIPLDIDSNIDNNYGADQGGTISFAGITDSGTPSELTASGSLIYLYTDGLTLVGSTLANSSYSNVASSENESYKVFTVELNPDADLTESSDTYSFTLHQQIDGGASTFSVAEGGYTPSGGNSPYYFLDDTSGDDRDILLTPTEAGSTVNTSKNDFATGTQMTIGGNEGIRIDFVKGLAGNANKGPVTYDSHYTVQGAGAIIGVKSGTSTVRIAAYDDYDDGISADPDDISIGNGDIDTITAVVIQYGEESLTVYSGTESATVGGQTFTLVWDDPDYTGQVLVGGVVDGTALAAVTDDGFSSLEFHYDAGTAFTVNSFSGVAVTPGEAVDFALDLNLTDADGDTALIEDAISLQLSPDDHVIEMGTDNDDTLDAGTDQASTLVGLAGDDALSGDSGDDILVGGPGNDSLAGGAGADTFVWNFGDQGTSTDPAEDTVMDFTSSQGDVLDISDLLSNMSDGADLSGYIQAEESGSDTILYISSEGSLTADDVSAADQTILLSNVDMGEMDATQFLQSLINEGQLDIE
ncbi:beta strand repeat-containing protein, partial [Halomonas ventosae]